MEIKFGLISCDSHAQLDKDAWTSRMSEAKWGDRIPQVVEVKKEGSEGSVDRWKVNGKVQGDFFGGSVVNCPAVMNGPTRPYYPQRWEEVPPKVYQPLERLKALDEDGVDAEVLFPNTPTSGGTFLYNDAEYELACVQAYNDALAEWRQESDRYVPLAIIPYLSPIETIVAEVERSAKKGHGGIVMLAEPSKSLKGLKHSNDPFWEPLWAVCQDHDLPIHWHGSSGLATQLSVPRWKGYTTRQFHTSSTGRLCSTPSQLIPNLFFSGRMDRYPRLKWMCAETGMGWFNFVLESCDHEWERRHLWTEGVLTRPSEAFRRQIYVDFWFEFSGVELRHKIGIDNIMWESDYPHVTSTYPESWKWVERVLEGVPKDEREKLLCTNAAKLYKLQ